MSFFLKMGFLQFVFDHFTKSVCLSVLQLVFIMSDLQRELWSLCCSFQVLLTVVGLQPCIIPLLGIAISWYKVRETLWTTETI